MRTPKYKHLSYEDRCVIQEFLDYNYSFTKIANRLGKDRRSVAKQVLKHRYLKKGSNLNKECIKTIKAPYVCNGCEKKNNCNKNRYRYDASIAHNEYKKTLIETRSVVHITKDQISSINEIISPLMIHKHHSVNHVYASHPELLPFG